jgi:hypothetical protein
MKKTFSKLKVKEFSKQQMQRVQGGALPCSDCVAMGCPPWGMCNGCCC